MCPSSIPPKITPTLSPFSSSANGKPSSPSSLKMEATSTVPPSKTSSWIPSILVASSSHQGLTSLNHDPKFHSITLHKAPSFSFCSSKNGPTLAPYQRTAQSTLSSFMSKENSSSSSSTTSTPFCDPKNSTTATVSSTFSFTSASLQINTQTTTTVEPSLWATSNLGWCSTKHCTYPQWLIFRLDLETNAFEPKQVHSIQLLFHHFKIPSLLEIWTTTTLPESSFFESLNLESISMSIPSNAWIRLGHIIPSTNIASHFKARELKTIPVSFKATYVKLVLNQPYPNLWNLWNQVSLLEVQFFNAPSSTSSTSNVPLGSPIHFDLTPFLNALAFMEEEKKQCVKQEHYLRAEDIKTLIHTLNEKMQEAENALALKDKACLEEDYPLAEQYKQQLKTMFHSFFQLSLEHGFFIDPSTGHTTVTSKPTSTNVSSLVSNTTTSSLPISQTEKGLEIANKAVSSSSFHSSNQNEPSFPLYQHPSFTSSMSSVSSLTDLSSAFHSNSSIPHPSSSRSFSPTTHPSSIVSSSTAIQPSYVSSSTSPSPPRLTSSLSFSTTDSATSPTSPFKVNQSLEPLSFGSPTVVSSFPQFEPASSSFTSKPIPHDPMRSSMIQFTPDQCTEYAVCMDVFGPELMFYFLSKDFETKEKGLKGIYAFLTESSHPLDSMLVMKASFLVIEKTLMDSRERIACWCFQVWQYLVLHLKALHFFWQSTQTLFPQLLTRVGDTNIRVVKAAHELAVTLLMKHPSTLVPLVLKSFPPPVQWRGIKARLHLICDTLDTLGLSVYDPMLVKALISDHLAHTHHEVRDMATQVLLLLAQWLDLSSLEPCLDTIPQRFHRQALRMKLLGVQRRAVSVLDHHSSSSSSSSSPSPSSSPLPHRSLTPHTSVTQKRKLWPRWFSKSGTTSMSTSNAKTTPSIRTSSLSSPTRGQNLALSPSKSSFSEDIACVFCNEVNPEFSIPSNLDTHYLKECPLLSECPYCNKIIELTQYKDHHLHECTAPTRPPITTISESHCPLCRISFHGKSIHHLLKHLLTGTGCPQSKRKPKPNFNYKSKLK